MSVKVLLPNNKMETVSISGCGWRRRNLITTIITWLRVKDANKHFVLIDRGTERPANPDEYSDECSPNQRVVGDMWFQLIRKCVRACVC